MAVLASGHKLVKCGADGAISGVVHDETLSGNGTSAEPLGALLENVIFDDSIFETDEDGNTIIGVNPVWVNYVVSASGGECGCSGKLDTSALNLSVTGGVVPESAYYGINQVPFQAKYDENGNVINDTYLKKNQFNSGAFVKYDEDLKPLLIGSGNSAGNGNAPKVAIGFDNDVRPESFTFGKNNINYGECSIFGEKNEGWDKSLLVGYNNSSQHCALNVGSNNYAFTESIAVGDNISADGRSIGVGNATSAVNNSFSLGNGSVAKYQSVAVGTGCSSTYGSIAIATQSAVATGHSFAMGSNTTALNESFALGNNASAYKYSFAFGNQARCANTAIAMGNYASADWCGVAIGDMTEADAFSVAIGGNAKAYGSNSVAVGDSQVYSKMGIAIGFANYSENSGAAFGSCLHAGEKTMVFGSYNSSANSAMHGWVFACNPFDHSNNKDALTIDEFGKLSARGQVSGLDCVSVGNGNVSSVSLRDLYNAFTAYTASHP